MTKSNRVNTNNKSDEPNSTGSPLKKAGRKTLGNVLQYSPKRGVTKVNKVFVTGTQFGIILLRTEKQNSKDDAFTNDVVRMIEDESSGVAAKLQIIKICSRRQSQILDKAVLQTSLYPSQWFVSIKEEEDNNAKTRLEHAEKFIKFLNDAPWKYPQTFTFAGDETKHDKDGENGKIIGTLDEYLLNLDIGTILKTYVFEDFESFLQDEDAINQVFGGKPTSNQARNWLVDGWLKIGASA
jgi:hypothetical protein